MTYEELLSDIDSENFRNSRTLETPYAALRAVLELHKPKEGFAWPECPVCAGHWDSPAESPCATIQAIERELR